MFTWNDNQIDKYIYEKGYPVLMCAISKQNANNFVKDISNEINKKLDWHFVAGRNVIMTASQDYKEVLEYLYQLPEEVFYKYGMKTDGFVLH